MCVCHIINDKGSSHTSNLAQCCISLAGPHQQGVIGRMAIAQQWYRMLSLLHLWSLLTNDHQTGSAVAMFVCVCVCVCSTSASQQSSIAEEFVEEIATASDASWIGSHHHHSSGHVSVRVDSITLVVMWLLVSWHHHPGSYVSVCVMTSLLWQ